MSDRFLIKGENPLKGRVEVSGYKNAAGAILAATLLTKEECIIDNLPLVSDILNMIELLKGMGVEIEWLSQKKVKIRAGESVDPEKIDASMIGKMRTSVLLMGPLLSSFGSFKISPPGGDRIGLRPISVHLDAFSKMGVSVEKEKGLYQFSVKRLKGHEVILKEFSVTATENLMMAAVRADGKTIIKTAAAEPQVQDLGKMLQNMGANIKGLGTHTIEIEGVEELKGVCHRIIPDLLEAGTFIVAGAVTQGVLEVGDIMPEHLDFFLAKLEEIGVEFEKGHDFVKVNYCQNPRPTRVQAFPYPGFPTDLIPIIVPLLTQAKGKSLIHDPMYDNRLGYIHELRKMEADIEIVDPHRAFIWGRTPLTGADISSWDIRAGACLVIAGLLAKGETTIEEVYQIDRGYEKIEEKLRNVGADIKRLSK